MARSINRTFGWVLFVLGTMVLLAPAALAREWSPLGSDLKINGELVAYDGKTARIAIVTGQTVNVPLNRLSEADQTYLKTTFPNGKDPEKLSEGKKPAKEPAADDASESVANAAPSRPRSTSAAASPTPSGGAAMEEPASANQPAASKPSQRRLELIGLAIFKAAPGTATGGDTDAFAPGMHLRVYVNAGKDIYGIDTEKSKIASCLDNKKTDLLEGGEATFSFEPSEDGQGGVISIHLSQAPAAKSVRAMLKGEAHLQTDPDGGETLRVPLNFELLVGI